MSLLLLTFTYIRLVSGRPWVAKEESALIGVQINTVSESAPGRDIWRGRTVLMGGPTNTSPPIILQGLGIKIVGRCDSVGGCIKIITLEPRNEWPVLVVYGGKMMLIIMK
jgi:hypothetical protein